MRVTKISDAAIERVSKLSQETTVPDRITATGKRILYTGRNKDAEAGVYFVGAMGANLVKIGWVRKISKLEDRLDRLRIDCPYPVMPLYVFGPALRTHESRLHKHFDAMHFHGEWFRFDGELREVLELAQSDSQAAHDRLYKISHPKFEQD